MVSKHLNPIVRQTQNYSTCIINKKIWFNSKTSGFTLIELLTVVTIIGILAGISTIGYFRYVEKAKVISAISEINTLVKEIRIYMVDNDTPPDSLAHPDISLGAFQDPWGNPYQYVNHSDPIQLPSARTKGGSLINTEFDVFSMGKDGVSVPNIGAAESHDDIIRAGDDEYVGKATGY